MSHQKFSESSSTFVVGATHEVVGTEIKGPDMTAWCQAPGPPQTVTLNFILFALNALYICLFLLNCVKLKIALIP